MWQFEILKHWLKYPLRVTLTLFATTMTESFTLHEVVMTSFQKPLPTTALSQEHSLTCSCSCITFSLIRQQMSNIETHDLYDVNETLKTVGELDQCTSPTERFSCDTSSSTVYLDRHSIVNGEINLLGPLNIPSDCLQLLLSCFFTVSQ